VAPQTGGGEVRGRRGRRARRPADKQQPSLSALQLAIDTDLGSQGLLARSSGSRLPRPVHAEAETTRRPLLLPGEDPPPALTGCDVGVAQPPWQLGAGDAERLPERQVEQRAGADLSERPTRLVGEQARAAQSVPPLRWAPPILVGLARVEPRRMSRRPRILPAGRPSTVRSSLDHLGSARFLRPSFGIEIPLISDQLLPLQKKSIANPSSACVGAKKKAPRLSPRIAAAARWLSQPGQT